MKLCPKYTLDKFNFGFKGKMKLKFTTNRLMIVKVADFSLKIA